MASELALTTTFAGTYEEAIPAVTAALKDVGFGVLTQIDVKATLKEKLGVDEPPMIILGACNPRLAHQVLTEAPELSVLLPCNVVVRETATGTVEVMAMNPVAALGLVSHPGVAAVAAQVKAMLEKVLTSLAR